jgi:DNA-binding transcriptional ArsR family regulator
MRLDRDRRPRYNFTQKLTIDTSDHTPQRREDIPDGLDSVFDALANRHRREIVYVLGLQPYSISQLAEQRGLSLPAIHKHIRILESAGMVKRRKIGRTTYLTLDRASLRGLQTWLGQYQAYWGTEQETLANYEAFLRRPERPTNLHDKETP